MRTRAELALFSWVGLSWVGLSWVGLSWVFLCSGWLFAGDVFADEPADIDVEIELNVWAYEWWYVEDEGFF